MNQLIVPAATSLSPASAPSLAPRAAGVADAPDVLFVLRRYVWIIIGGITIGTILAALAYLYMRSTHPRYTAAVIFQVYPPPTRPGLTQQQTESFTTPDEINRFIQRQVYLITSEDMLGSALQLDAFQHDPDTGKRTQWMTENSSNMKKYLRRDLSASAVPNTDLFRISMTTGDPTEAAHLVNAVKSLYLEKLKSNSQTNSNIQITQLDGMIEKQQKTVADGESEVATFRQSHSISAITNQHAIEVTLLGQMNTDLMKIQSDQSAAEQNLETVSQQVAKGSLKLSAEEEEMVVNDPQLRSLESQRLGFLQDYAVALKEAAPNSSQLRALQTRIATIENQIQGNRETLRKQAQDRMQENAVNIALGLKAQVEYYEKARNAQELKVRDLDYFLVQYTEKMDDLKVQQDILQRLIQEKSTEELSLTTDDTRVRQFSADAQPPDPSEISSPMWYFYLPTGFLAGFLLSFGLAYFFELTNTRVRTPRDVTRTMQMPLLGFVPDEDDDTAITGELSTAIRTAPASMIAESFRQIRTRLVAEANGSPFSTVLIASIAPGGGATTVATNLAIGLAGNEKRVLLVDANFYRPGLQSIFKDIPAVGLSNLIVDGASLQDAVAPMPDVPNLYIMSAGSKASQMNAEKLDSKAFVDLLETLKRSYDVVIFDGAPLSLVSDSITLAARMSGVIGVVRAGEVSQGTVTRVRDQLKHNRANFLGLVLNAARTHGAGYFKENYRSFYRYAGKRSPDVHVSAN